MHYPVYILPCILVGTQGLPFFSITKSSMIEALYIIEIFIFVGWTHYRTQCILSNKWNIYMKCIQIEEEVPQISEIPPSLEKW